MHYVMGRQPLAESGREVLIKAIVRVLSTYVMWIFKLPISVCDDLSKLTRKFLWGLEQGERKTHWISWDKMKMSKIRRIWFHNMRIFNQALLARQAWRLIQLPNSMCARVLKGRYYPQGHILDTMFSGQSSSKWTAISYGLLKKRMTWRIGNGESVCIGVTIGYPAMMHLNL